AELRLADLQVRMRVADVRRGRSNRDHGYSLSLADGARRGECGQANGLKGSATLSPRSSQTNLTSVNSSTASAPFSRPSPLSLNPPNGVAKLVLRYVLIHTVPAASRRAMRCARLTSRVQTPAASP